MRNPARRGILLAVLVRVVRVFAVRFFAVLVRVALVSAALVFAALVFAALAAAVPAHAQTTLHIAAAADLEPILPRLAAGYEAGHPGTHLAFSFGSSATLVQQIRNGSPADVFLAADRGYAQQVVDAGLAAESAPLPYARGVLVLWARRGAVAGPLTLQALADARVHRIAVANPDHAPYGRAARAALHHERLLPALAAKLVTADNIAQAAQFALTGNADVGLISLTIASTPQFAEAGAFTRVPAADYAPLEQCGVALRGSAHRRDAEQFLAWLRSPAVQRELSRLGLDPAN